MKRKIINVLLVLMVGAAMFNAQPAYAQEEPPIDLSIDRNGNQISDAVEAEAATLQALPEDQQSAEIENFVSKLQFNADTLALQERAQQLSVSLSAATPEEAPVILEELSKISSELEKDPVIAKVESDLLTLTGYGINEADPSMSVAFASLQKGHILARKSWYGFVFPWAMKYEHTGNYNGNFQVLESNPDGVRLRPLSQWQSWGQYVGLAYNIHSSSGSGSAAQAVDWAAGKYGTDGRTPYNWNFADKWTDASLYCAQLTWKIHSRTGYNLDSNHWLYLLTMSIKFGYGILPVVINAVAPDEVMLSPHVRVYSEGWN